MALHADVCEGCKGYFFLAMYAEAVPFIPLYMDLANKFGEPVNNEILFNLLLEEEGHMGGSCLGNVHQEMPKGILLLLLFHCWWCIFSVFRPVASFTTVLSSAFRLGASKIKSNPKVFKYTAPKVFIS